MESRSVKSFNNIVSGVFGKMLMFLFAFFARTVFIKILGAEYTGINGLYSNILTVLSLADFGVVQVLSFFLYEALRDNDQNQIAAVIQSFRKIYLLIGMAVFGIGVLMMPFLPYVIHSSLDDFHLMEYYVLFLLNMSCSYFFVYKTTILTADQKQYYENLVTAAVQIVMYILQIMYLLLFRNYTGFLIIQIVCTAVRNIVLSRIADKKYPYIKRKPADTKEYKFDFKSRIGRDIRSAMLYKAGSTALNHTDNILISAIAGTVQVGYYSNYSLIFGYIGAYVHIAASGITASLGSVNAEKNADKSYSVYRTILFLFLAGAGILVNVSGCCVQEVISVWLGEEYVLDNVTFAAVLIMVYVNYICTPPAIFRETLGYFEEVKCMMIPAAVINIVLSAALGRKYGTAGILIATPVSKLLTQFWYEPGVLYKKAFHQPYHLFWVQQIKFLTVTSGCMLANLFLCSFLPGTFFGILARAAVSGAVTTGAVILTNLHSDEMKDIIRRIRFTQKH